MASKKIVGHISVDDIRSAPSAEFIAGIRHRFPVEREIDRILTRKMLMRADAADTLLPLDRLVSGTRALIRSQIGEDFAIHDPHWLSGGASKLQMGFVLDWSPDGTAARTRTAMVLRMEPPASIVETSRKREFEMLTAMRDTVPVPPCYWVDATGDHLPYPGLIYGFAEGVTKPRASASRQVSGIGVAFDPELRAALSSQFIDHLAAIHTASPAGLALDSFDPVQAGSNAGVIRQVNWWRRVWEEDRPADSPIIDVAARWLIANAPVTDHVSVVHGDYRAGNFLFSEETRRITAWLDWELAALGDRHQDLTWTSGPAFGRLAEDGRTFLVCGLLPREEFFERYEAASGLTIDPARLTYFRVFNDFVGAVHMLATAWRVVRHGKTHQDVVVAWLSMIGHLALGSLRNTLEELI